jgi:SIR2-like domain
MLDLLSLRSLLADHKSLVKDPGVLVYLLEAIEKDLEPLQDDAEAWRKFSMLWPPRLVHAYRSRRLIPFFGAGVSIAAGLPSWTSLLRDNFGLGPEFLEDKDLEYDPLTLAELAAQHVGADKLQDTLHVRYGSAKVPTSAHLLACSLRCPIYITTNYDILFEEAWRRVNPGTHLHVVTNDLDVDGLQFSEGELRRTSSDAILIKIHGSADRQDEQLVLTRRDYRHHYRSNAKLFDMLHRLLSADHVLFLGFSHRDPEVSRLVDDAIFDYEKRQVKFDELTPEVRPHFYSLQFSMLAHTPEVYAARGLVALRPPTLKRDADDSRSTALSLALAELVVAGDRDTHAHVRLDDELNNSARHIGAPLQGALEALQGFEKQALHNLHDGAAPTDWLGTLRRRLEALASQGVWLLNDAGQVVAFDVPTGHNVASRRSAKSFSQRPYFRQAKTYRRPFVSDTAKSVFNGRSTFFVCHPLMKGKAFAGLLFAASQTGSWDLPEKVARQYWDLGLSFVLVDSNGVALLPPRKEFLPSGHPGPPGAEEPHSTNFGYPHDDLLSLSRRDFLVSQIARNIVPVGQDDDIATVASDLKIYSAITEVRNTAWKLCLARAIVQPVETA